jgi:hypothetical protein
MNVETSLLKHCLRDPIPEIAEAANLLDAAISAHCAGEHSRAEHLIRLADIPAIREWTEWLWGQTHIVKRLEASTLAKPVRVPKRNPTRAQERLLHERDGYHCRFCSAPVIRAAVRKRLRELYPAAARWGNTNAEQHTALQAMWVQYDHVTPHARGGTNDIDNLVVACAPCNCARMDATVEEVGLLDPRERKPTRSSWDGLERLLA